MALEPHTMKTSAIIDMLGNPVALLITSLDDHGEITGAERNAIMVSQRQLLLDELDKRIPVPA